MSENQIKISNNIFISFNEIEITATRSSGPGGQHVNKVSSAIQLRFNVHTSSLPDFCKERLLKLNDKRLTDNGEIIIRAREFKSQIKNREAAVFRLVALIREVLVTRKKRKPTKPGAAAHEKRLDRKSKRSKTKSLRKKIRSWD